MGNDVVADYRAARGFARAAQGASWVLALAWSAIIIFSSGLIGSDLPLAAQLPDIVATMAFVGLMLVGAAVVHAMLEAAVAIFRLAGDARSLPSIEHNVRMNAQLPAALSQPVEEPRIVEERPIAQPVDPVLRRRPITA